MKNKDRYQFSEITSFEDFQLEKERLSLKRKLVETRLRLSYIQFSEALSISNMMLAAAKEFIFPKISDILEGLLKKAEDNES